MLRRRQGPADALPAPTAPDPAAPTDAEAWIAYLRRRADAGWPYGVARPADRHAARTEALRAGDFSITEPTVGL